MSKQSSPLSYLAVAGGTLLFYICALPIADAISTLIQTKIGSHVTKIQYVMAQDQEETAEIADRVNGSGVVQAIGFDAGNPPMMEDDDDE